MKKDDVKQMALAAIEASTEELKALGDELLHTPETAFKETESSAIVKRMLTELGLSCREGLAMTGLRADLQTGRTGPTVAILGNLTQSVCPHTPSPIKSRAPHTRAVTMRRARH